MFHKTAIAVGFVLSATGSAMAQAACPGLLPLVATVSVAVGATVHVTPLDQNCSAIPNDLNNVITLLNTSGLATWALDSSGPGLNITGVASGNMSNVKIQWKDQYPLSVHPAITSAGFSIFVTAPPPAVTAIGSVSP